MFRELKINGTTLPRPDGDLEFSSVKVKKQLMQNVINIYDSEKHVRNARAQLRTGGLYQLSVKMEEL